jgi:hypothetical protein
LSQLARKEKRNKKKYGRTVAMRGKMGGNWKKANTERKEQ